MSRLISEGAFYSGLVQWAVSEFFQSKMRHLKVQNFENGGVHVQNDSVKSNDPGECDNIYIFKRVYLFDFFI